ncbi:MAG: alpha/beta family hydrolase, partial [Alphaproteobacteria bacterium]
MTCPDLLIDGPDDADMTIALAHGAGAAMDSAFMEYFADALAGQGFRVARFEFPYMNQRRIDGKKRPPNTAKILLETWGLVIDELGPENLIIGGKSMGGRIASMLADEAGVRGLVCLGYP